MPDHPAAQTQMSDHVDRFWRHLETQTVRICVDMRRTVATETPDGPVHYWNASSFSDDVAKALAAERAADKAEIERLKELYSFMSKASAQHLADAAHASAKLAASEAINTNLRAALKDTLRMLEAVRYTSGLGKGQMERIERFKAFLSAKNPDQQDDGGSN